MTAHPPADRSVELPGPASGEAPDGTSDTQTTRQPDWWHRDHPTFTALTGFLAGLAFVILVPGVFVAVLYSIFDDHTAEELFPLVLVTLVVPFGLVAAPRTRRFGLYMCIGMVVTALVVAGVTALVLWYMVEFQS